MRAWAEDEPFAFDGKYNQLRYVNCWPKPIQKPHPPIYIPGGGSIETWDFCLDHDYNYSYLSFFGYLRAKPLMDGYWEPRGRARGRTIALSRRLRPDHLRGGHRRRGRGPLRRALPLLLQPLPPRLPGLRGPARLPHHRHDQVRRALPAPPGRAEDPREPHLEADSWTSASSSRAAPRPSASSSRSASRGCGSAMCSACSTRATCRTGRRATPPSCSPRRSCPSCATSGRSGRTTTAGGCKPMDDRLRPEEPPAGGRRRGGAPERVRKSRQRVTAAVETRTGDDPPRIGAACSRPAAGRRSSSSTAPAGSSADNPFLDDLARAAPCLRPRVAGLRRVHRRGAARGHARLRAARLGPGRRPRALARPHLVGHSMGGMIAAEMACLAPHDLGRLVLVSAAGLWLDDQPIPDIFAALPFEIAGPALRRSRSRARRSSPAGSTSTTWTR